MRVLPCTQESEALPRREDARERGALPHRVAALGLLQGGPDGRLQTLVQDPLPLFIVGPRAAVPDAPPPCERRLRRLEQRRLTPDLLGDEPVHREAARVDLPVRSHHSSPCLRGAGRARSSRQPDEPCTPPTPRA